MSTASNGGDPRTYKSKTKKYLLCIYILHFSFKIIFLEVQDDNDTTTSSNNYQNHLNINVSPLNDTGTSNTDAFNTNIQQTSSSTSLNYSSSSTTNESESANRPSSDHGTTS